METEGFILELDSDSDYSFVTFICRLCCTLRMELIQMPIWLNLWLESPTSGKFVLLSALPTFHSTKENQLAAFIGTRGIRELFSFLPSS